MDMKRYDAALLEWAADEARAAEAARNAGDERALSLAQMKKSMYETMLMTLGHKSPEKLLKCADEMARRAEGFHARGDYDSEDRCMVQRGAILRAAGLLGLEVSAQ